MWQYQIVLPCILYEIAGRCSEVRLQSTTAYGPPPGPTLLG